MADEEQIEEKAEGGGGGGSKKLIIIIIVVVVLLVAGGVGAFFAFSGSKGGDETVAEGEEVYDEFAGEVVGAILPLDTFIVNLQVKGSFLKATMQLEFAEPELPPTIDNDLPKIRDSMIRVLSSRSSVEILNAEGKEELREELIDAVNDALEADDVVQIYFTEFIIQ